VNTVLVRALLQASIPHVWSLALCAARVLPVAFLCPVLGGRLAPSSVRLALTLALAACLHFVGGVGVAPGLSAWTLTGLAVKEMAFGLALGLIASLPFDAAKMGGRFIDLLRGTSAEAALPTIGSNEAATGEFLHQLLIALAVTAGALPVVISALFHSFGVVPLGGATLGDAAAWEIVRLVAGAFAIGVAIGAPVAGVTLACDCLVGLAAKAAPQMSLPQIATPLKILAGGAVIWLSLGVVSERLVGTALQMGDSFQTLTQMVR
jgi:flagellar biosynthetic protein FliR/type III secretion protein T